MDTHIPNPVRTDINCTNCNRNFVAQLDMSLDGNHVIECCWCGHHHYRQVKNGKVTDIRWDSDARQIVVPARCTWKSDSQPIVTSTASMYLREKWLDLLR